MSLGDSTLAGALHRLQQENELLKAEVRESYNLGFARGSGDEGAYQREIERLKALLKSIRDESLTCAMVCPHSCDGCERLYSVIRRSSPQSAEQT